MLKAEHNEDYEKYQYEIDQMKKNQYEKVDRAKNEVESNWKTRQRDLNKKLLEKEDEYKR